MNKLRTAPVRSEISLSPLKARRTNCVYETKKSLPEKPIKVKKKLKKKERQRNLNSLQYDSHWECLPDIILEDVFSRLTIKDRNNASQVCRNWNRIFHSPRVWNTFILSDYTLTRRKYDFYLGYQHLLDHHRTQLCLQRVGKNFRHIVIKPMENFRNLYGFFTVVTFFCEYLEFEPLHKVKSLDFTFGCEIKNSQDDNVFGTGGQLLKAFKRMMTNLPGLRHLSLQDLLLEKEEAMYLLDDVAYSCCETLRTLRLINCSKEPYAIYHAGVFVNLRKLTISPQHISDEVMELISYTNIRDLYLLQTKHTENVTPVSPKAWKMCRKVSPFLRVHLKIEGKLHAEIVWQEGAPVKSIIYDTPYSKISFSTIVSCTNMYRNNLQTYAHLGVPRFYMSRDYEERADSSLMLICRNCLYLHTIVIRELVSTSTLILVARECKNLRQLIVRRNAIIKKCDWPYNPEWTFDFYCKLMKVSKSYEQSFDEISDILGFPWAPLSDREFKKITI